MNLLRISIGCILTALLLVTALSSCQKVENREENKAVHMAKRWHHDSLYIADPETGEIYIENVVEAINNRERNSERNSVLTFTEVGPNNISGRVRALHVDYSDPTGMTLWAGGVSGGLWKSTDGGINWNKINDFLPVLSIGSIGQDPNNHQIFYVGTGEGYGATGGRGNGIYKSTDGGNTFSLLSSTDGLSSFNFIVDIVVTPASTVITGNQSRFCNRGGVLRSDNGGASWAIFQDDDNCSTVDGAVNFVSDLEMSSGGRIYAAFGGFGDNDGIYVSTDNGLSWAEIYTALEGESRLEIAISPSNQDILYMLIDNTSGDEVPIIKKSIDGGLEWETLSTPQWIPNNNCNIQQDNWGGGNTWYNLIAAVNPTNPDHVVIGAIDLFQSLDGGETWDQISAWAANCIPNMHADQHNIIFREDGEIWIANDGGIYLSSELASGNPTFQFLGNDLNVTQFYSCEYEPESGSDYLIGGTQDNGTIQLQSLSKQTGIIVSGGDGGHTHIDQSDPDFQLTSFIFNEYFFTENKWNTVRKTKLNDKGRFINPTDLDDDRNLLYAANDGMTYVRWRPSASSSHDEVNLNGVNIDGECTAIQLSPFTDDRLFMGFSSGEVVMIDDANTGTQKQATVIFDEVDGTVSCISFDPSDPNKMAVVLSNYGVPSIYYSENALATNPLWLSIEGNLPDIPIRWAAIHPEDGERIFLASEMGVWATDAISGNNTTWDLLDGLPYVRCDMIKIRPSDLRLYVATYGRGMFVSNSLSQVIDVDMDGFNSDKDCNDNNAAINPDAEEIPNNDVDENCDGEATIIDVDMDGFNSDVDCDDNNAAVNPDADEIPNNDVDENCDGEATIIDVDMDGFNSDDDCDDNNAAVNPDADEIPNNDVDENCDGEATIIDVDMDGFNSDVDCDDNNAAVNPDADEIPSNDVDENCDGEATIIDVDMDGFNSDDDCDDNNADINPDAEDIPNNNIDENCDGMDATSSYQKILDAGIRIGPNPMVDFISIQNTLDADISIVVRNIRGEEFHTAKSRSGRTQIDASTWPLGSYIISISDKKGKEIGSARIIKL